MSVVYYLDSSAWVKRYFSEAGSAWVQGLFKHEVSLAGTVLGYVEVAAAIARRTRPVVPLADLQHQLATEWNEMLQLQITNHIYEQGLRAAWDYKLRGADAIHLAAARQLHSYVFRRSIEFVLVTADQELINACKELRIPVTNPNEVT